MLFTISTYFMSQAHREHNDMITIKNEPINLL